MVGNSSAPDAAAEGERTGPDVTDAATPGVKAGVPAREPDPDRLPARIWTIPNALSIARLLGVPVFLWLVLGPHADGWAVVLLFAAAASDWLDGKLARALHQESRLGQVLDPTADRLYIGVMLIGLAIRGIIPWWLVGVLVGRELVLAVALLRLRARGWEPLQVSFVGKAATLCLFYAFPLLLLARTPGTPRWWPRWSAGRSWPGVPRCTGRRPGCTWCRSGGSPPAPVDLIQTVRWPKRNNRMANQIVALAGCERPS